MSRGAKCEKCKHCKLIMNYDVIICDFLNQHNCGAIAFMRPKLCFNFQRREKGEQE